MTTDLNQKSKPAYQMICDDVKCGILDGTYQPAEQLPTIKNLAKRYKVSLVTAVRAINILKEQGYVSTTWGGGCFIAEKAAVKKADRIATLTVSGEPLFSYDPIVSYWDQIFSQTIFGVQYQCAREKIKNQSILIPLATITDVDTLSVYLGQQLMDVDGAICVWHDINPQTAEYIQLAVAKPVIFSTFGVEGWHRFNCVQIDLYDLTCKMVQHLIDAGHERIACIAGVDLEDRCYRQRVEGYLDTLKKNNLPANKDLMFYTEDRQAAIFKCCSLCLDEYPKKGFTAVFCFNDYRALALMQTAEECGVVVPDQLAVAGFDGTPQAIKKGITTIQLPFYQVGCEATLLLEAIVDGRLQPPIQKRISPGIILGKSTTLNFSNN